MSSRRRPGSSNGTVDILDIEENKIRESPFQAELYLQRLLEEDNSDIDELIALPDTVDKAVWIYEHLRATLVELNQLIVALNTVCTAETDPSMKITVGKEECVFLCSAFNPPREVSAIDYMVNTVEQATTLFTSNKNFPSRITVKKSAAKHFGTWARRLYRIFAFAYFVHRDTFEAFEEKTHLCERFTKFCTMYKLMNTANLLIPSSRWA